MSAAFKAGDDTVRPVRPDTIAKSLAIGNPADGPYVLDVARRTGGAVEDVSDDEVVDGIRLLARTEGIFAETAGGVTVAVLRKLLATGQLDPDAETVVFNTGDGLKTLDAIADVVGPTATIAPTLDAFEQAGWHEPSDVGAPVRVRIPTILRTYTGGASTVRADGRHGRRGHRRTWKRLTRASGRGCVDEAGRVASIRERLCRRRGRAIRRWVWRATVARRRRCRSSRPSPAADAPAASRTLRR